MSYFNHETFGAGHMPPFETIFDIKQKKNSLRSTISDTIEDVEFEDITEEKPSEQPKAKEAPKYDKVARAEEIHAEAQKYIKKATSLGNDDFLIHLTIEVLFMHGAAWSDDNPASKFKSEKDRFDAFYKEMDKHVKEVESMSGEKDPKLSLFQISTSSLGYHWATKNPPKYY